MIIKLSKVLALPLLCLLFSAHTTTAQDDAGCILIITPASGSTLALNSSFPVEIRIENFGSTILTSIPVKFSLNGLGNTPLTETWTGTLAPGNTVDYTFSSQFTLVDTSDTVGYGIADLVPTDANVFNNSAYGDYDFDSSTGFKIKRENSTFFIEPIFPNPSSDNLSFVISGNANNKDLKISLMTIEGKIVKEFDYAAPQNKLLVNIDISELSAGLYFITATTAEGTIYRKFVK